MTESRRRWWPQMNSRLPRAMADEPRCRACRHPVGNHLDGRHCARWLTVAASKYDPPEVVLCDCPGLAT